MANSNLLLVRTRLIEGSPDAVGKVRAVERAILAVCQHSGVVQWVWDAASARMLSALPAFEAWGAAEVAAAEADTSTTLHDVEGDDFVCPGFVDLHHHAPQEVFSGTASDKPLMEWLEAYTFPSEMRMSCAETAAADYARVVRKSVRNGTTTSVYFATTHVDASIALADACRDAGQRAYIGHLTMDRNAPDSYRQASADQALSETAAFFERLGRSEEDGSRGCDEQEQQRPRPRLVQPILTPRFVPTSSAELLHGLGAFRAGVHERAGVAEPPVLVTTHVSESLDEVAFVKALAGEHSGEERDVAILAAAGLLRDSVLAHCVHLTDDEMRAAARARAGIAHCPLSNCFFAHAPLKARRAVEVHGVAVGLGTDVAGGYDPSMLSAVRHCVTTSLCLGQAENEEQAAFPLPGEHVIDYQFAFWLATVGGARVLQRDDLGALAAGCRFDALHVTPHGAPSRLEVSERDNPMDVFQKWVNLGDDRHIQAVWVDGRKVVSSPQTG